MTNSTRSAEPMNSHGLMTRSSWLVRHVALPRERRPPAPVEPRSGILTLLERIACSRVANKGEKWQSRVSIHKQCRLSPRLTRFGADPQLVVALLRLELQDRLSLCRGLSRVPSAEGSSQLSGTLPRPVQAQTPIDAVAMCTRRFPSLASWRRPPSAPRMTGIRATRSLASISPAPS